MGSFLAVVPDPTTALGGVVDSVTGAATPLAVAGIAAAAAFLALRVGWKVVSKYVSKIG